MAIANRLILGTAIPRELVAGINRPYTYLAVRNRDLVAVGLSEIDSKLTSGRPAVTHRTLIACLTSNNERHEVPLGSAGFSVRGFGTNLAITEMADRRVATDEQSAGQEEWRKEGSRWGGSVKYAIEADDNAYPGRLHIYNVATRRDHLIVTRQADSEVLLVEGDTVYYRVSNRLYQATLAAGGVTNRVLVATSDVLRDVHWAFRSVAHAN